MTIYRDPVTQGYSSSRSIILIVISVGNSNSYGRDIFKGRKVEFLAILSMMGDGRRSSDLQEINGGKESEEK